MKNDKILSVVAADYVGDYKLCLTFNNGEIRVVDFVPLMQKGICTKLQNLEYFRSFTLDPFTIDWNNEIGFAPEFLYEQGVPCDDRQIYSQVAERQEHYGNK